MAAIGTPQEQDKQESGQEDRDCHYDRTRDAKHEISGDRADDHHWAWRDDSERDAIDKLPLGEPVMVADKSLMQERARSLDRSRT